MFCNKTFLNKSNLIRHINLYCEKKNKLIKEKSNIDKLKDKEIRFLRKNVLDFIKYNSEKYGNICITNNDNKNITNNNNIYIQINSFGKEDLSHITNELKKLIYKIFIYLTK